MHIDILIIYDKIKKNVDEFSEEYTIFITNESSYLKTPRKTDCIYSQFSLEDVIKKLDWHENTSEGTKKNCENPIILENECFINWDSYSEIDDSNTGKFYILINKIEKNGVFIKIGSCQKSGY